MTHFWLRYTFALRISCVFTALGLLASLLDFDHVCLRRLQTITIGGDAELGLCDALDPFTEGVEFAVRPPKKSWKQIQNLSGGEKTLASLSLVFALHHYKPTPLYVMDEIDAALDFRNVSILAHYIKVRAICAVNIELQHKYV